MPLRFATSCSAAFTVSSDTLTPARLARGLLRGALLLGRSSWGGRGPPDRLGGGGVRRRSDTGGAGKFRLQPAAGLLAGRWVVTVHEPARAQPPPPAARTVLEAGETLQWGVIAQRVDVPREHVPLAPDGPGRRELDLVEPLLKRLRDPLHQLLYQHEALVAVGEVEHRIAGALVLQVDRSAFAALILWIPLHPGVRAPGPKGGERELRHEIRALAAPRSFPGQDHTRGLEGVGLPEGGGQELAAVVRIQHAAGEAGTDLAGIADAVGADVAVGAKQLHGIEVRKRAVEQDRKSTRLNSSHLVISYAVFCLKK